VADNRRFTINRLIESALIDFLDKYENPENQKSGIPETLKSVIPEIQKSGIPENQKSGLTEKNVIENSKILF
jgi:hypothetical protein